MSDSSGVQLCLKYDAILNVPLNKYEQDFTFIVNHKKYQTNRFISDLLSREISQQHLVDPTIDTFTINTQQKGDFSHFLKLISFQKENLPQDEILFISEILKILNNDYIEKIDPIEGVKLTFNNVFANLKKNLKFPEFYSSQIERDIEFISSNFYELNKEQQEEIYEFEENDDIIERIISNEQLQLRDEDQMINFVNKLYLKNSKYYQLYEYVLFSFVSENQINEFIKIFDINDINSSIWKNISYRLKRVTSQSINEDEKKLERKHKYKFSTEMKTTFSYSNDKEFDGIINFIRKKTNNNVKNMIKLSSSSMNYSNTPYNVCKHDNDNIFYQSKNEKNSWICFDFKEHKIIPTNYTIKSIPYESNNNHPKSWVVEGSNDNIDWITIDEVKNCDLLNGFSKIHTFNISNPVNTPFRYVRIRQTSNNWYASGEWYFFSIGSVEFYGSLI